VEGLIQNDSLGGRCSHVTLKVTAYWEHCKIRANMTMKTVGLVLLAFLLTGCAEQTAIQTGGQGYLWQGYLWQGRDPGTFGAKNCPLRQECTVR
jgi:hypothetical protein